MGIKTAKTFAKGVGDSLSLTSKVPNQRPRTDESSPRVCGVDSGVERLTSLVSPILEQLSIGNVVPLVAPDR